MPAAKTASLKEYHRKRHFGRTLEPKGKEHSLRGHSYLIQKHAASRLHYDFRLELEGVLKSWAVPKGPSVRNSDRRLAVHVEDHPIEYGKFEGTIPKPEYGAGSVMLWDRGAWEPLGDSVEDYKRGKLKFILHGERLHGRWALVRMRPREGEEDKNWLLIKDKDGADSGDNGADPVEEFQTSVTTGRTMEQIASGAAKVWHSNRTKEKTISQKSSVSENRERGTNPKPAKQSAAPKIHSAGKTNGKISDTRKLNGAKPAAMPENFHPQLATLVTEPPAGDEWVHELKFDGYRILAFLKDGKARLMTRNEKNWTEQFAAVAHIVEKLPVKNAIIDGEVVIQKADGTTDFQLLQNYIKGEKKRQLTYEAFDLPYLNGQDLTGVPLRERKEALRKLLISAGKKVSSTIRFSDHLSGQGKAVYRSACHHALEGIISKRLDSLYVQDRSSDWVKVKCLKQQEFVIGGYTDPKGGRQHFGSLLIGAFEGEKLIYHGHVGTGFNQTTLNQVYEELKKHKQGRSPFSGSTEDKLGRVVQWVKPALVCEVAFSGWTDSGNCRHPVFIGLREDKEPSEVHVETPKKISASAESAVHTSRRTIRPRADNSEIVEGVQLTHPDRILYVEQNITKRDLAAYYEKVADHILPHIAGRPLVLVRCPAGQEKACFYQKHAADASDVLRRIMIQEKGSRGEYLIADDVKGLISLAQMAVLELHMWGSTEKKLEKPDRMVLDLDPAPDTPWKKVVLAAQRLKERLDALSLRSFVKTTGGKGLHVVVPLIPDLEWDPFKEFSKAVCGLLQQDFPDDYVLKSTKSLRPGKIFLDYLRNGRGATSICSFSTRAKPGATVSMPIGWDELSSIKPNEFTLSTVPSLLSKRKKDPWADFFNIKQAIPAIMKKSLLHKKR